MEPQTAEAGCTPGSPKSRPPSPAGRVLTLGFPPGHYEDHTQQPPPPRPGNNRSANAVSTSGLAGEAERMPTEKGPASPARCPPTPGTQLGPGSHVLFDASSGHSFRPRGRPQTQAKPISLSPSNFWCCDRDTESQESERQKQTLVKKKKEKKRTKLMRRKCKTTQEAPDGLSPPLREPPDLSP